VTVDAPPPLEQIVRGVYVGASPAPAGARHFHIVVIDGVRRSVSLTGRAFLIRMRMETGGSWHLFSSHFCCSLSVGPPIVLSGLLNARPVCWDALLPMRFYPTRNQRTNAEKQAGGLNFPRIDSRDTATLCAYFLVSASMPCQVSDVDALLRAKSGWCVRNGSLSFGFHPVIRGARRITYGVEFPLSPRWECAGNTPRTPKHGVKQTAVACEYWRVRTPIWPERSLHRRCSE